MNKLTLEAPVQGPPAPAGSPAAAAAATSAAATPPSGPTGPTGAPQPRDTTQPAETAAGQARAQSPDPTAKQPRAQRPVDAADGRPPRLSAAVLAQIATALRQGGGDALPLATQADLVALHKRIAEMFTTLNDGLGTQQAAKAAADRSALSARIDQLEEAVNRMEGALRIEFEPVLKAAVTEALAQAAPRPRRRWRGALAAALLAGAALMAGAWYHAPLLEAAQNLGQLLADGQLIWRDGAR
jgi:small-conductance mechanosensitive channel